jgi:glycerate kinase
VLTGEGRLDASTLHGKLVFRVLRAAWRAHVPVAVVCGQLAGDPALLRQYGTVVCEALVSEGTTREEAMRRSAHLTEEKTAKLLMYR